MAMSAHKILLDLAKTLTKNEKVGGICFGFSTLYLMSRLIDDYATFSERLNLLLDYHEQGKIDRLAKEIDELKLKIRDSQQTPYKPTLEELQLLEIQAFFENLIVQHDSKSYSDFFNYSSSQEFSRNNWISQPSILTAESDREKSNHTPQSIGHCACILDKDEALTYFNNLAEHFSQSGQELCHTLFSSNRHTTVISYNTKDKTWEFMDINLLSKSKYIHNLSTDQLIKTLFKNEYTLFALETYALGENRELTQKLFELNTPYLKEPYSNTEDDRGNTLLYLAAKYNYIEIVKTLIDNGANVNWPRNDEWTPLHIAAACGHLEMVNMLLDNKAEINETEEKGATALCFAAYHGHNDVVQTLLSRGADASLRTREGHSALAFASHQGHSQIEGYLKSHLSHPQLSQEIDTDHDTHAAESIPVASNKYSFWLPATVAIGVGVGIGCYLYQKSR